jgi:hypothetical protein
MLTCAECGVFWRRFSNVIPDGIPRFICATYGVFWGRRFERLRDTLCRFPHVSIFFSRPIDAACGSLWRRRYDWRRDARRLFSNDVSSGIRSLTCAKCSVFGSVVMSGIATLGVGFPTSCRMASRYSIMLNMAAFVGVHVLVAFPIPSGGSRAINVTSFLRDTMTGTATLVVGFPTSCLMPSRGSSVPNMASRDGVAKNGVATLRVGF